MFDGGIDSFHLVDYDPPLVPRYPLRSMPQSQFILQLPLPSPRRLSHAHRINMSLTIGQVIKELIHGMLWGPRSRDFFLFFRFPLFFLVVLYRYLIIVHKF
jgi:hypothetical protein